MPKRIIIVDDEPDFRMILTRRLISHGYLVLSASSSADLLAKLPSFRPDAILLDVLMPGIDGIQVAEQLDRISATASTPIIFLSSLISAHHPQDSSSNTRHHFLGKPFMSETLLGLLRRIGV